MATLSNKNGRRTIQFPALDGRGRKTLRLGKINLKAAQLARSHVDDLIANRKSGHPIARATSLWLADISDDLYTKLATFGLVEPRGQKAIPIELGAFLQDYIDGRSDLKERSASNLLQVRQWLVKFFGTSKDLRTITRGDIGDWHRHVKKNLSAATVSAHVTKGRQMFQDAVDRKLIAENPFKKLKAGTQVNAARQEYVTPADTTKLIDACPDAEWRVIFALSRFAGLRIPSESRRLKWSDVNWGESRMTVWSPKTEHHEGKEKRIVPIFPELYPYLRETMDAAEDGAVHVINRHRGENLRTRAEKIIDRAGLVRWPKLFHNLRASCETDLMERFPMHVVCAWLGNSPKIAARHYLQVTAEHFERAVKSAADTSGQVRTNSELAVQNPQCLPENSKTQYPRQGSKYSRDVAENLRSTERALQNALQHVQSVASRRRVRDLAHIRHRIALARRRIGGGA